MHRLLLMAVAAALVATGWSSRAQALPLGVPLQGVDAIQKVATCFYTDGWHGPGFYRCGFRVRTGEGWIRERTEERLGRAERRLEFREDRREDRRERRGY